MPAYHHALESGASAEELLRYACLQWYLTPAPPQPPQEPRTADDERIHRMESTSGTAASMRLKPRAVTSFSESPITDWTVVEMEALITTEAAHTMKAATSARNRTKKWPKTVASTA